MQLSAESLIKDDLAGAMSIKFVPDSPIDEFFEQHIENYSAERYEVLAVRVYYGKEITLTVFAIDNTHLSTDGTYHEKVGVKKFKLQNIHLKELFNFVEEFNFTLTTGKYPLDAMEVLNK
jgi:hypothetical protein